MNLYCLVRDLVYRHKAQNRSAPYTINTVADTNTIFKIKMWDLKMLTDENGDNDDLGPNVT